MGKVYSGHRTAEGARIVLVDGNPLYHVQHHADGFEWGYGGSGPADLALSILADHYGERPTKLQLRRGACKCWPPHQQFKQDIIARLPRETGIRWELTGEQIDRWLDDWVMSRQNRHT